MIEPGPYFGRAPLAWGAFLAVLTFAPAPALAQESPLRAVAKAAGYATDVDPPPDFVLQSRPAAPPTPMPVFNTPDEPPSKVMSNRDLKALDADLESAGKKHDVLRSRFGPAARAVAAAQAARKAKMKNKPPETSAKPAQ